MCWTIQVVLAEAAGIFLLRNIPTDSVARPVPTDLSSGVKRTEPEPHHSPASSAQLKN